MSEELFNNIKLISVFSYKPYYFNVYLFKTYHIVKDLLLEFPNNVSFSVIPLDVCVQNILFELKKRLFLTYNSFLFSGMYDFDGDMEYSTCGIICVI